MVCFGASFLYISQNYTFKITYSRTCECARENCYGMQMETGRGNRSLNSPGLNVNRYFGTSRSARTVPKVGNSCFRSVQPFLTPILLRALPAAIMLRGERRKRGEIKRPTVAFLRRKMRRVWQYGK